MPQLDFLRAWLLAHARNVRGASLVEYCLLVAFIALACFAAVQVLGGKTSQPYSEMGNSLT